MDDTTECEIACDIKGKERKKEVNFLRLFFTTHLPHNFHKSKIRTWTHVAQLPSPWALSEGPFNRKMCRCIFFCLSLFFLAHWFTLFLLCGCWPNQLKRMLKSIFHYTALSAYLWCVFMQNVAHLHIFLLWIVLTSQRATRTSFCCSENGSSSFMWSVYFSPSDPNLSLHHFIFFSSPSDCLFKNGFCGHMNSKYPKVTKSPDSASSLNCHAKNEWDLSMPLPV